MIVIPAPPWEQPTLSASVRAPRVLVVEDSDLTRTAVVTTLHQHYRVSAAATGEAALALATEAAATGDPFQLAVVDILMPEAAIEGIACARELASAHTMACLMFTTLYDATTRMAATFAGAVGYLVKDDPTVDLVATVAAALTGAPLPLPVAPHDLHAAAGAFHQAQGSARAWQQLSTREQEVASLAEAGLTNNEIATKLIISSKTVGTHMESVLSKLGLATRREINSGRVVYISKKGTPQ